MSINASDYSIFLGDTIFELMAFGNNAETDKAYEYYLQLMKKALKIDMKKEFERLYDLADSIYFSLVVKKLQNKRNKSLRL